jgi:hypothetical protein
MAARSWLALRPTSFRDHGMGRNNVDAETIRVCIQTRARCAHTSASGRLAPRDEFPAESFPR